MSLLKKIATVACGTLMSRTFGFLREMLMAAALGTGPVADAFNAAFRFPNTFRRLFAEGAFNSAFVPLFSKQIEEEGIESARKFSEEVFGVLFSILIVLTVIMELSMPLLVTYVIAPGFTAYPEKFNATIRFATIMFPYLACMSLAAMMGGMLNSLHRYFAAAIAPVFLNIILICVLAYAWFAKLDVWHVGLYLSWGALISGVVQLLIIWVAIYNAGMKIKLRLPKFTANVRGLLLLAFPAAITGGITQINLLINTNIASSQSGAVSSLVYADRLYQLPLGVVGIAVATVLLPELSRALRAKNIEESNNLQNRSIEFTLLLTLPASAAFLVMSEPIVRLLFQRGQFDNEATLTVAAILGIYGLGLPAFVLIKAFIPGFFAREDTKTPMIFAGISVVVNIVLAIILFPLLSAKGIAIAEITAGWVNTILLLVTLIKRGHWKKDKQLLMRVPRLLIASIIMGIVLYFAIQHFHYVLSIETPLLIRALSVFALIMGAMVVYFIAVFAIGGANISMLKRILQRKKT